MPCFRLQVSMAADSAFARDRFVITPHFNVGAGAVNAQSLCDDLAAALHTWCVGAGTREIKVTAYDAQGTPPVLPVAEKIVNTGLAPASGTIREVALCLSFFGNVNRPRYRGRLYIPVAIFKSPGAALGLRPVATDISKVAALAPIFTGLGGADVDWSVYSRADDAIRSVKNWWVDDEWDIMRSRGLRPTSRTTGTTTEA